MRWLLPVFFLTTLIHCDAILVFWRNCGDGVLGLDGAFRQAALAVHSLIRAVRRWVSRRQIWLFCCHVTALLSTTSTTITTLSSGPRPRHFHSWVLSVWPEAGDGAVGQLVTGAPDWLKVTGAGPPPVRAMPDICWVIWDRKQRRGVTVWVHQSKKSYSVMSEPGSGGWGFSIL